MVDRAQCIKKMTSQHEEGGNSFDKCIRLLHPFKSLRLYISKK